MFKKGHDHTKDTVIFVKIRQMPITNETGKQAQKGNGQAPNTGGKGAFANKGMVDGPIVQEKEGAQDGKTPLGIWRGKKGGQPIADDIVY